MNTNNQATTQWLLNQQTPLPPEIWVSQPTENNPEGVKSRTHQESLQAIQTFWEKYWNRPEPQDLVEIIHAWSQACGSPASLQIPPLTGKLLHTQARKLQGSAAGLDGFHWDDLWMLPEPVWEIFSTLIHRWLQRGEVPTAWLHIRQIHLPKDTPKDNSPSDPSKLRPISIMSIWWRLVTSSSAKTPEVREWIQTIAPPSSHGGIAGREAFHGILALENRWRSQKGIIVSQDFEKCFDTISPEMALAIMQQAGFPPLWARLISKVWTQQHRWITYGSATAEAPCIVTRSLPQGDALSPLALIVMMAAPLCQLETVLPGTITSGFLDDRVTCVNRPQDVSILLQFWETWADRYKMISDDG